MTKAVIFDCFGVIITDALGVIIAGLEKNDLAKAKRIINLVDVAGEGVMDLDAARTAIAAELGMSKDEYVETILGKEAKNIVLLEYIQELRATYKTAMLSNVIKGGLEARFSDDELSQHFDAVVASGDIGFAKPEAQAYEYVADKLGIRLDECVMVDDREDYCEGATGVGMKAIQYINLEQMRRELESILNNEHSV